MEYIEYLNKQMERDPFYAAALPLSIRLHKFERDHQDFSKPRIFLKEYDEEGFTNGFNVNKMYRNILSKKIDDLMRKFSKNGLKGADGLLGLIDRDKNIYNKIKIMLVMDKTEGEIYESLGKKNIELTYNLSPLIERKYDEIGIPIAYALNSRIIDIHSLDLNEEERKIKIKIRDFEEEIALTNIDELFNRLIQKEN